MVIFRTPLTFRYATEGAKAQTRIKKTDRIVYGIEDYHLVGFTVHEGINSLSGHYYGYLTETLEKFDDHGGMRKDKYGQICPPDCDVISRKELDIAKEKGYVYFYKKITNR